MVGVVRGIQRAQRAAAGDHAVQRGQQEGAARWGVFTRQLAQLALAVLEAQGDAQAVGVLAKDGPYRLDLPATDGDVLD